jgi:hypothetical protein|eukprot:g3018.t1
MGAGASSAAITSAVKEREASTVVLGSSQTGASIDARGNGSDAKKPGTSVANEGGHSPVAQGKSAFRALLSLDEKELVVGRSPGSHLRKMAGVDDDPKAVLLRNMQRKEQQKLGKKKRGGPVKMVRKMNTTSTLLSLSSTMENAPADITIKCISHVIRTHIAVASERACDYPVIARKWEVFNDRADLLQSPTRRGSKGISVFHDAVRDSPVGRQSPPSFDNALPVQTGGDLPDPALIVKFISHIYKTAQMEIDSLIISLIYLERLLETGVETGLILLKHNWKTMVFTCLMLGSKIWDDLAMENKDLATLWPPITLKRVNQLERRALEALKYNVKVPASLYAKYYFRLRSLVTYLDLPDDEVSAAFDAMEPLSSAEARKMEVLSKRYEERVVDDSFARPTMVKRSMSFDSGMSHSNVHGQSQVPASLDEFLTQAKEQATDDFGFGIMRRGSVWKRRTTSQDSED